MSCVLCESNESVEIAKVGRHNLPVRNVICKKCGLIYVDPQPSQDELSDYYDNEFRKKHIRRDKEDKDIVRRREKVASFLSNYLFKDMNILEIGCAEGALLDCLGKVAKTEKLFGVEPTTDLAHRAKEEFGIDAFAGLFEDYASDHKMDLVIMQHVLEHCADPLETLKKIRNMLSDKGVLFVEVPSARKPYGDFIYNFLQVPHLFSFSPKTLKLLFKRAGFNIRLEPRGALAFVLDKGDLFDLESLNFEEEGEPYSELLHFLKVYTYWHRSINDKDKENAKQNQNIVLLDDNELSKEITKMYFQVIKNRLRAEISDNNGKNIELLLSIIEKDQVISAPESVEFLLMQRDIAKANGDSRTCRQYERKIRMIKNLLKRADGSM